MDEDEQTEEQTEEQHRLLVIDLANIEELREDFAVLMSDIVAAYGDDE